MTPSPRPLTPRQVMALQILNEVYVAPSPLLDAVAQAEKARRRR